MGSREDFRPTPDQPLQVGDVVRSNDYRDDNRKRKVIAEKSTWIHRNGMPVLMRFYQLDGPTKTWVRADRIGINGQRGPSTGYRRVRL